jgi:hypothetical protein
VPGPQKVADPSILDAHLPVVRLGWRIPVGVYALVAESLNLAHHGARAAKQGFNITLEQSLDPAAGKVDVFPRRLSGRVCSARLRALSSSCSSITEGLRPRNAVVAVSCDFECRGFRRGGFVGWPVPPLDRMSPSPSEPRRISA